MLRTDESETEILLGNKQLLGIFLVVAVLLGVSFTGGFMIGRGGMAKKGATATATVPDATASPTAGGGQTHTLEGETTLPAAAAGGADTEAAMPSSKTQADSPISKTSPDSEGGTPRTSGSVLGGHKHAASSLPVASGEPRDAEPEPKGSDNTPSGYEPRAGSEYLQVVAVARNEAEGIADVLHKKGFHAHAVPKPGNTKLYRVIIGPVKDAGELSSTRDALRKTGFREVIVQRY